MPTLYVKEQGAVLSREGERIIARKGGGVLVEMPTLHVERLVTMGNVHLTTPLTAFLLEQRIDTVFLSSHGRYRGRLLAPEGGHVALRRRQYERSADPGFCLDLARRMIAAKLHSQAALLARRKGDAVRFAAKELRKLAGQVDRVGDLEGVRGYEGTAARLYFEAFGSICKGEFVFQGRTKHPPNDPLNALLSLGYSLLFADTLSALYVEGFDPYLGFLHQERSGHAALASDLMEEFRAPVVDVVVLGLCNRGAIKPKDFRRRRGQGVRLNDTALRLFFEEYDRRMEARVQVPAYGQQYAYRAALGQQARCLAAVVVGDREVYEPFQMRQ